jgi:bis(5'-adenosyl)-triphosphatase
MASTFVFGQWRPAVSQLFFRSKLSLGLVNLKPVVPGHILVIPKRLSLRYADLRPDEVADLWITAQTIGKRLEAHYKCSSLTFVIQDGHEAGQTVNHVHVHIMPRRKGDFDRNDDIYREIEKERPPRSELEMAKDASELAALFPEYQIEGIE